MPTIALIQSVSGGGVSIQGNTQRTCDGQEGLELSVPAAFAGVLSNRVSNVAGTINGLPTGHGLTTGNICDIFWTVAGVTGRRYNVTMDTCNANDISFDDTPAAAGDNLPVQGSAVTICKQVVVNSVWDGDDSVMYCAMQTTRGLVQFRDAGAATLKVVDLLGYEPWGWSNGQGIANPLTGNPVATLRVTNADSTQVATFRLVNGFDSTP